MPRLTFLAVVCVCVCSCDKIDAIENVTQTPSVALNGSAIDVLNNVFGVFGKLLNNTNGLNGIGDFLNGLLQGGAGDKKWTTQKPKTTSERPDSESQNILEFLQPLLPMLASTGLSDPMKLIPMALSYLQSLDPVLQASGVSNSCRKDMNLWFKGLGRFEGWAWKMIDSSFKIPSNLAGFNLKWLGDMEECTAIQANIYDNVTAKTEQFDGKYCRIIFPLGDLGGGGQLLILGSCASSRCSNDDVTIMVNSLVSAVAPEGFPLKALVSCIGDTPELDSKAIAAICILGVLGALVVIGTIYDAIAIQMTSQKESKPPVLISTIPRESPPPYIAYDKMPGEEGGGDGYSITNSDKGATNNRTEDAQNMAPANPGERKLQRTPKSILGKILIAFSVYTNGCKLLGTGQGAGSLGAVNGIRFLSMAWVILGHTYFFAVGYATNAAPLTGKKFNQWTFTAIINASVSVDTFFALSGILVAYLTLRELKKVGGACKFNWFMFYFHRFWRLTPPYMLILMCGTVLYKYLTQGPLSQGEGESTFMVNCKDSWWTNLLYVNNYVNVDKSCMGWTWYLANDMQMYIISPLILLPLFYNVIFGGITSTLFLAGTIAATAIITNEHQYPAQSWSPFAPKQDEHYFKQMYIPASTRLGPYLVGLVTGYVLYKCKCRFRIPVMINLACWLLCIGAVCSIVYGPFTKDDEHIFTAEQSTAYNTLFRTGWGVAICWIVFACATGYGGWINELLSWSPFVPLGRLTYCAYLLHPFVMAYYYETSPKPVYFSDYGIIYLFLGNLVLSYGAAFMVSLFFESPMMGLEKALFKKK
ncbi:O-acyltransferase like protein-like [Mercenaria mercenaria]|uniref:O-acyltransferase like protein-like n=1 Tax=Mercenaria mercenaria TaxID=6596 RepID=UPI00234E4B9B|nr:O-acyltransferase like protein-like [Mercenaria mercenaria]